MKGGKVELGPIGIVSGGGAAGTDKFEIELGPILTRARNRLKVLYQTLKNWDLANKCKLAVYKARQGTRKRLHLPLLRHFNRFHR